VLRPSASLRSWLAYGALFEAPLRLAGGRRALARRPPGLVDCPDM